MILIEIGAPTLEPFQRAVAFADQLNRAGLDVALNAETIPEDIPLFQLFEAHRFLNRSPEEPYSGLIVLGTDMLDTDRLNNFRQIRLSPDAKILAFGHFDNQHGKFNAAAKLSYVTDRHTEVLNLSEMEHTVAGNSLCPSFGVNIPLRASPMLRGKTAVTIFAGSEMGPQELSALQYISASRSFTSLSLMSGKQKTEWHRIYGSGAHVYSFSEILPSSLTQMSSVVVLGGAVGNNDRALCLLNNAIVSGRAVVDATPEGLFEAEGLPVLRGPADLGYLKPYLDETILPNLDALSEEAQVNSIANRVQPALLLETFADSKIKTPAKTKRTEAALHIMPTNGIGLGHAQRMVLISEDLPKSCKKPEFLAFPSCLPMINRAGFDAVPLVPRSDLHSHGTANDLANFARIRAKAKEGDTFVFDGGYVFDSIYHSILERNLNAIWVRRGLWRASQNNRIPLDREKCFNKVIVPREAFEELDQDISTGSHVSAVGPIVRRLDPATDFKAVRKQLAKTLGVEFSKLVVTMLGSGVVHDLSAHVQSICNNVEQREDALHLIVVWPGSVLPPERYAWKRSKVVTSQQAGLLAASADAVVSAAGYNSFLEAMYNRVPTIFVPQTAQILDDQTARAEAAAERGLAAYVQDTKLSQLDRELAKFLDQDKAKTIRSALDAYKFPETGNAKAAQIIAESMS